MLLFHVLRAGHEDVVRVLLAAGARPNECSGDTASPLWLALSWRRAPSLVRLLLEAGANPNLTFGSGAPKIGEDKRITMLGMAVQNDDVACVRLLVAAGADLEAESGSWRRCWRPLGAAASAGRFSIVVALLAAGARPDSTSGEFHSCVLQGALERCHAPVVALLLVAGAWVHGAVRGMSNANDRSMLVCVLNAIRVRASRTTGWQTTARTLVGMLLASGLSVSDEPRFRRN